MKISVESRNKTWRGRTEGCDDTLSTGFAESPRHQHKVTSCIASFCCDRVGVGGLRDDGEGRSGSDSVETGEGSVQRA